jgi:hypothetical protein
VQPAVKTADATETKRRGSGDFMARKTLGRCDKVTNQKFPPLLFVSSEEEPQRVQANHQRAPLVRGDANRQWNRAERRGDHHHDHYPERNREILPDNRPRPSAKT